MSFETDKKGTAWEASGEETATRPEPKDPPKGGGKPKLSQRRWMLSKSIHSYSL